MVSQEFCTLFFGSRFEKIVRKALQCSGPLGGQALAACDLCTEPPYLSYVFMRSCSQCLLPALLVVLCTGESGELCDLQSPDCDLQVELIQTASILEERVRPETRYV